jgi:hypothetical protein
MFDNSTHASTKDEPVERLRKGVWSSVGSAQLLEQSHRPYRPLFKEKSMNAASPALPGHY